MSDFIKKKLSKTKKKQICVSKIYQQVFQSQHTSSSSFKCALCDIIMCGFLIVLLLDLDGC